ncbi:MAG: SUMF1/EgtB/PvdO family nonheme iron enzyme, partial [Bdellovibrionaceae bacterium]|nr:SUMF1/EgtB/PvdO family nonheme iron enzyme [Pseudobdellovibrionaceae bacterium]
MNKVISFVLGMVMAVLLLPYSYSIETTGDQVSTVPLFKFVWIPEGSFVMRSPMNIKNNDQYPSVSVTISRPFEIMTTEVTQEQWYMVMGENPSKFKSPEYCNNYDSVKDICP